MQTKKKSRNKMKVKQKKFMLIASNFLLEFDIKIDKKNIWTSNKKWIEKDSKNI